MRINSKFSKKLKIKECTFYVIDLQFSKMDNTKLFVGEQ